MNKKLSSIIAVMTLSLLLQTGAIAQPMFDDNAEGPPQIEQNKNKMGQGQYQKGMNGKQGHHMKMMKELNLTEEQKALLKKQRENSKTQMSTLRKQMKQEREKMFKIMFDPNSTKDQMLTQQQQVSSVKNKMGKIKIEGLAYMKGILTPEQKVKFQELSAKKMQQHKKHWQNKQNKSQ